MSKRLQNTQFLPEDINFYRIFKLLQGERDT